MQATSQIPAQPAQRPARRVCSQGERRLAEPALQRIWYRIELVEPVVRVKTERFALHFEIPAIPNGTPSKFAVLGKVGRGAGPVNRADVRAQLLKLVEQRFECLAD